MKNTQKMLGPVVLIKKKKRRIVCMRCMKRDTIKFVVERGEGNYFTKIDFNSEENLLNIDGSVSFRILYSTAHFFFFRFQL
jgi:hypothetical protein